MTDLQGHFNDAVRLAHQFLQTGEPKVQCVLHAYARAGGLAFGDGCPIAFVAQQIQNGDPLLTEMLLHAGIVLTDDAPGSVRPHPLKQRDRIALHQHRCSNAVNTHIDARTGGTPWWGHLLTQLIRLHANTFHVGRRRTAFLHLLQAQHPTLLPLFERATGIRA
ncbi:MAG: hypothetical protein GX539_09495 [Candidatus Cloacimonetes bacterium]|nr:hypothetical protein [Candidatus Cloacimonadota bacterium]